MNTFDRFLEVYPSDDGARGFAGWTDAQTAVLLGRDAPAYTLFQRSYARPSHGDGLVRFVGDRGVGAAALSSTEWNGAQGWRTSWPDRPKLVVVAYDWLARHYALDGARVAGGEPLVTLLDPSDGAVMESDMTFTDFIATLAGEDGAGILAKRLHAAWRASGGEAPGPRQCIGFVQPLLLGGKQTADNLKLGDMDVYLTLLAQVRARVAQARAKP